MTLQYGEGQNSNDSRLRELFLTTTMENAMPKYKTIIDKQNAVYVLVNAKNKKEALDKFNNGEWTDEYPTDQATYYPCGDIELHEVETDNE